MPLNHDPIRRIAPAVTALAILVSAAVLTYGSPPVEGRLAAALAALPAELDAPGDVILPAGSTVDAVAVEERMLTVDLTIPFTPGEMPLTGPEVDRLTEFFLDLADPGRETIGIVVRFRRELAEAYRPLGAEVAASPAGVYEEPLDVPEVVDVGPVDAGGLRAGPVATAGHQPAGALSGVTVFANAGHGWTAGSSSWFLQRPLLLNMIEDYGNIDQLNYFVQYCFNAGATVVAFRPVGYQNVEIVLDQDDPGVTYTGSWTNSTGTPHYENNVTASGVGYRFASASAVESATARYTPNIPAAGHYPVYTWALDSSNRTTQLYRIVHDGGTTEVVIDHRMVGRGWVWLGNYYFAAGTGGYVEISNESSAGGVVVADAVRFGNGIGDVVGAGPGTVSGYPRDEEAARYWAESETNLNANGMSTSIYDCCTLDSDDNVGTAARWSREMNNTSVNNDRWRRVYLEFHTNASSGTARGTVALISTATQTTNQALFAQILGDEIENDMLVLDDDFEHPWGIRNPNTFSGSYGAISINNNSNEFDATILEVAFHDNAEDAQLMLDPKVRDVVGRSSVHGIIKFLNALPGSTVPLAFPPDRPRQVQAVHDGAGGVVVSWIAPLVGDAYGDAPTGYRLYRSSSGHGFDSGLDVGLTTTYTLTDVPAGAATYLRVAAYSPGGESMPSETLAVRRAPADTGTFLIVNGFDRVGRAQDPYQTLAGVGTQRRPLLHRVNTFDYAVQQGDALAAAGATFDSCANEAVIAGAVVLDDYGALSWITGEESSADQTFDATEQALVTTYLNGGGNLFVSGAEIGWDLDNLDNGRSFYNNLLKADYSLDDANTYNVAAAGGSIFAGLGSFSFDNGAVFYDAEFPDVLNTFGGSVPALTYVGGTGGNAGVVFDGAFKIVNLGFPFETITSAVRRAEIMDRVVGFFFNGPFDADRDGDVDVDDHADFAGCLQGPAITYGGGPCLIHDGDGDGDVDLADFEAFMRAFTGP